MGKWFDNNFRRRWSSGKHPLAVVVQCKNKEDSSFTWNTSTGSLIDVHNDYTATGI